MFIWRTNQNRLGGTAQLKVGHKAVTIIANTTVGERCPVFILDNYISMLPTAAIEKDIFYCRPLPFMPKGEDEPWYRAVPVDKNLWAKMVPEMCSEAGIVNKKISQNLRVSGATTVFDAQVPEWIIHQRTGNFLIDGSITALPDESDHQVVESLRQWRFCQSLVHHLWT